MDRKNAVEAARYIMSGPRPVELERLDVIAEALKPWSRYGAIRQLQLTGRTEEPNFGMKWRSQTNFLPLLLDVYSQSMKLDNYLSSKTKETASPWVWWQRNKMAARQTGIIRSVLAYGAAYTSVLPSMNPMGGEKGAFVRALSPRQMTCLYGDPIEWTPGETPVDDDWPIMALEIKGAAIRLYDEESVHFIGVENVPQSTLGWTDPTLYGSADNFKYLEARPHNVGVCPIVRYRDRWLLDGEEQYGIVEPLINIQARIDETTYEMSAAQYFTAFTQRWVAGWRPRDEAEALAQIAGDVWYFSDKETKVGTFEAGDTKNYVESGDSARRDFAAIGQVPPQALGINALSNISEATLAGLESGKERKSAEIQTALGESFEQLFRTCAHITGDKTAAEDFDAEVKWQDATARSFAQTVDGLGKLKEMLGIPEEILWEDIPGWTKTKVDRAVELRNSQPEPPPPPAVPAGPPVITPDAPAASVAPGE